MNDKNSEKLEYDVQKRAKAGTAATFRGIVAVYIMYLGYNIVKATEDGTSTLPDWAGWTAGVFFIAAALVFGVYIWNRYRRDLEAARLPDDTDGTGDAPEETPDEEYLPGEAEEENDWEDGP